MTNGEYLAFIEAGGYRAAGILAVVRLDDGQRAALGGAALLDEARRRVVEFHPLRDAARSMKPSRSRTSAISKPTLSRNWSGARLPTEFEWERAAADFRSKATLSTRSAFIPLRSPLSGNGKLQQMFGDVWEWTRSAYLPYPGYRAAPGALGEYNGKFMSNQMVLRGGSCATSQNHIRPTYRNFFQPEKRWQFTGIRLARDPA